MAPPPEPSPTPPDLKAQQDIINMRLAEEKLRQELLDLRRPYLFRNPQLLTALIASVGAIVGAIVLINGDFYNVQKERNALLADKTDRLRADAEKGKTDAAQIMAAADRTKNGGPKTGQGVQRRNQG
jgi:hypothetical protein